MPEPGFRFEPLGNHSRAAFSCGVPALDRYFREQAGQEIRRHVAAVRVLYDVANDRVAGFYTLSAASIEPAGLTPDTVRRLPRYPALPALLIGRLAVDTHYQGQGLGGMFLAEALRRALALQRELGIVAVIVDAKDEAAKRFYEHHGFRRFAEEQRRLYLMTATVAKLDLPGRSKG